MKGTYIFGRRCLGFWAWEGHHVGLEVEIVGRGCCRASGDDRARDQRLRLCFIFGVEAVLMALVDDNERDVGSGLGVATLKACLFHGRESLV